MVGQQAMEPNEDEKNEQSAMSLQAVHRVLKEAANLKSDAKTGAAPEDDINEVHLSEQMKCSLKLGSALWSLDATSWSDMPVNGNGHRGLATSESSSRPLQQKAKTEVHIRERVYARLFAKSADAWFARIQQETIAPNAEQLAYLHDIRDRCETESTYTTSTKHNSCT